MVSRYIHKIIIPDVLQIKVKLKEFPALIKLLVRQLSRYYSCFTSGQQPLLCHCPPKLHRQTATYWPLCKYTSRRFSQVKIPRMVFRVNCRPITTYTDIPCWSKTEYILRQLNRHYSCFRTTTSTMPLSPQGAQTNCNLKDFLSSKFQEWYSEWIVDQLQPVQISPSDPKLSI